MSNRWRLNMFLIWLMGWMYLGWIVHKFRWKLNRFSLNRWSLTKWRSNRFNFYRWSYSGLKRFRLNSWRFNRWRINRWIKHSLTRCIKHRWWIKRICNPKRWKWKPRVLVEWIYWRLNNRSQNLGFILLKTYNFSKLLDAEKIMNVMGMENVDKYITTIIHILEC